CSHQQPTPGPPHATRARKVRCAAWTLRPVTRSARYRLLHASAVAFLFHLYVQSLRRVVPEDVDHLHDHFVCTRFGILVLRKEFDLRVSTSSIRLPLIVESIVLEPTLHSPVV